MKGFLSKKMKLADIISFNYNLALLLPRFGMKLGFGDKSVTEVCSKYGVPVDFFILVCNVYSFDEYIPSKYEVKETDISSLINYLNISHQHYINDRIPKIEMLLNSIADKSGEKYATLLKEFFAGYKNEVLEHFDYEEENVFPYLEALINREPHPDYHIKDYKVSHSNIEDKLSDLMPIIFKYLPGNVAQEESVELMFSIMEFSNDLKKHSLIEEKILVPYVELLERYGR
jgi:regulator of cell morphogenesis and NO signaling